MFLHVLSRMSDDTQKNRSNTEYQKFGLEDEPDLLKVIEDILRFKKVDPEIERIIREQEKRIRHKEIELLKARESWVQLWNELDKDPIDLLSTETSWKVAWNLWRATGGASSSSKRAGWNRHLLENYFGKDTVDKLRIAMMKAWRNESPTLPSERPKDGKGTYQLSWVFGLAGVYAESEDRNWASKLGASEAQLACRFVLIEGNSLPRWIEDLVTDQPVILENVLANELDKALHEDSGHLMFIQKIRNAEASVAQFFLPTIYRYFKEPGTMDFDPDDEPFKLERLRQLIELIETHSDLKTHRELATIAAAQLQTNLPKALLLVWLPVLMRIDTGKGLRALNAKIEEFLPSAENDIVDLFAQLFGDRRDAVDPKGDDFTPATLLNLIRVAYQHIRIADDIEYEGSSTAQSRYDAQRARERLVSALLDAKGNDGWSAKLELADDPSCAYFRDRILAEADERWAEEINSIPFDDAQAVALDIKGDAPGTTNESMFRIMKDRLLELDDLLLRDGSQKEEWSSIKVEKIMRRAISRELDHLSKGLYRVDQEAATAEEKETDIRMRSTASDLESVIEVKIADGRSGKDLFATIYNQLVRKYMAPENRRSGCLLITLSKDCNWNHPDTKKRINTEELMAVLRSEASRICKNTGGELLIRIHLLDLRPRLPKENEK